MSLESDVARRLEDVRGRIEQAARASHRSPSAVRLIAVCKTFSADHVRAAAAAGQKMFGENRVQEGLQKMTALTDLVLDWHLIGHLQSNKARKAAESFACIHSIDSVELLIRLDQAAAAAGKSIDALVQVDLAGETTKHGATPDQLPAIVEAAGECHAVRLTGLMLLPPLFDDAEGARPYFERLRHLRDDVVARGAPPDRLRELSMGMSHDFEVAIQEGSTMVRVGTAIFGGRHV